MTPVQKLGEKRRRLSVLPRPIDREIGAEHASHRSFGKTLMGGKAVAVYALSR
jgi:hypothetical protein